MNKQNKEILLYLKNYYEEACKRIHLKGSKINDEYIKIKEFLLNLLTDEKAIIDIEYNTTENQSNFIRIKCKSGDYNGCSSLKRYKLYTFSIYS